MSISIILPDAARSVLHIDGLHFVDARERAYAGYRQIAGGAKKLRCCWKYIALAVGEQYRYGGVALYLYLIDHMSIFLFR